MNYNCMIELETINALNILILHKRNSIKLKKNIYRLTLLKKFLELGIIKSIKYDKNSYIISRNLLYKSKVSLVYSNTKKISIKYNFLKKLKNTYIIKTTKGFLTTEEAFNYKIGGLLVAKL